MPELDYGALSSLNQRLAPFIARHFTLSHQGYRNTTSNDRHPEEGKIIGQLGKPARHAECEHQAKNQEHHISTFFALFPQTRCFCVVLVESLNELVQLL